MRVLLDHCVPRQFRKELAGHEVRTAASLGMDVLSNGHLIRAADVAGFDALVTTDKSFRFQQNLSGMRVTLIVIDTLQVRPDTVCALGPKVRNLLDQLVPRQVLIATDRDI